MWISPNETKLTLNRRKKCERDGECKKNWLNTLSKYQKINTRNAVKECLVGCFFSLSLSRVLLLPVRLMVLTLDFPYILVDYFDVVTHYRLAWTLSVIDFVMHLTIIDSLLVSNITAHSLYLPPVSLFCLATGNVCNIAHSHNFLTVVLPLPHNCLIMSSSKV